MIETSTRIDESEEQTHLDGDGSEMAKELREKEYRLKRLNEARETLEREKLKRVNITDLESHLMCAF
ncbi:unnamed protein product [marine sediment metagenome]|uniref:Uncharacterized protein n=1 Tax=marine sediment metagenome TaxID=412755 RepID=X1IIQ3_9ZZZZ